MGYDFMFVAFGEKENLEFPASFEEIADYGLGMDIPAKAFSHAISQISLLHYCVLD